MSAFLDSLMTLVLGFLFFIVISAVFGGEPQPASFFLAIIVSHLFNEKHQLTTRFINFWTSFTAL